MEIDPNLQHVLEFRDVSFRRGGTEILHEVSFAVARGEHWVMLGPNGAGKTTVLGFCGALVHPSAGEVTVLGHRLGRVELQALRRHIGHVNPRHPASGRLTVLDAVLTGFTGTAALPPRWQPTPQQVDRARHLVATVGMSALEDAGWGTLSQGERGRTLIARALASDPALLLLDEPTTGLDVAAREQFLDTVDELVQTHRDLTSVLVTHHLEELPESTSHALLLAHGRVSAVGRASEVLTSERVSTAFDYPIEVERRAGRWAARTARSIGA